MRKETANKIIEAFRKLLIDGEMKLSISPLIDQIQREVDADEIMEIEFHKLQEDVKNYRKALALAGKLASTCQHLMIADAATLSSRAFDMQEALDNYNSFIIQILIQKK